MTAPRTKGLICVQALLDAVITLSLFWLCLLLFMRFKPGGNYAAFRESYLLSSLMACGLVLAHAARSVYASPRLWGAAFKEAHGLALAQTITVAVGLSLFLVAAKEKGISRLFLFSFLPVLYSGLLVANRFLLPLIARAFFRNRRERTLFLGPAERSPALAGWMRHQERLEDRFVEFRPGSFAHWLETLEETIRREEITQVIVTDVPEPKYDLPALIGICEALGVRVLVFSPFEHLFRHKAALIEDGGLQFLGLRSEPLESPCNRAIKRAMDLAIALPVAAFVLPLMTVFVWGIQRRHSPGPVFYRQERAGLKGRPFRIWKFRTMHPNHGRDSSQAAPGDTRVFRGARWLRRTSLDELPQFINVLKGEMSLAGPRPHLIEHNERFGRILRNYYIRTMVKPGITGLAQARGFRGQTLHEQDIINRVQSDIRYIETWSVSLDLLILARTAWQILRPPKAAV